MYSNNLALRLALVSSILLSVQAFSVSTSTRSHSIRLWSSNNDWTSDFDDNDDDDALAFAKLYQSRATPTDLTAIQTRQFSLGEDLILDTYIGNMGFDEVTDWEYYYQNIEDPTDRKVVAPNPFDTSTPKRTRTSSGSVVRLFRGACVGLLGGILSANAQDKRVLIKEFTGDLALELARAELQAIGRLQTDFVSREGDSSAQKGDWIPVAASRSVRAREDNMHVAQLVNLLRKAPFVGILGEVNLAEFEDDLDPNEFYRALGVAPPKPGAVWIVYEYAGLTSLQAYSQPAQVRRAALPVQKGFFGNIVEPPSLPAWEDRAKYVVQGIMKGTIEAVASLHESGLVHRSLGRSSVILSSKAMDKREAVSPYATMIGQLRVKLSDFGFSGLYKESTDTEEFCARARTFGLSFRRGERSVATTNFAIAEDMHALGFVFLGLLLTSLAELPTADSPMPATDEDTLQRLLGEIFDKDMDQFREYIEAEDVWSKLVELLDAYNGAGWTVLETLLLAREKVAKMKDTDQMFTVRGLLSNAFFQ